MDKIRVYSNQRGVSLIETLVALTIFLIAGLGWLQLESALAVETGNNQAQFQAVNHAQSYIELLRQVPIDLDSGWPDEWEKGSTTVKYFNPEGEETTPEPDFFTLTIKITEKSLTVREADLTVSWTNLNSKDAVESVIGFKVARSQ